VRSSNAAGARERWVSERGVSASYRQGARRVLLGGVSLLLSAVVSASVAGCSEKPSTAETVQAGTLQLGLGAELNGVSYRLEGTFDVTDPDFILSLATQTEDAVTSLSAELPAGAYVVTIRPGFVVSKLSSGSFEPVAAQLVSEAAQGFSIAADATSRVTYRFAVPGGQVSFGSGSLEIGFEVVTEGPECRPPEGPEAALGLQEIASGLVEPVFVTAAPGDSRRLFIVEKRGTIRVLVDGELAPEPFVDLSTQLVNQGERGLLGLAFHPNYAQNGLFYVHFSANGSGGVALGTGVVAELAADPDDRSHALPDSQRTLLSIAQPEANHNGGMLAFGADGDLYLGLGDGGGGNDQHGAIGNGQALDTLLGKILRIDVDARTVGGAYGIPAGNLAQVTGRAALPEIWAYGVRNPWRMDFDVCNGDLYIGDVGQDTLEEIDFLPGGAPAGTNFGWRIMEGDACRPGAGACDPTGLTLPVAVYDHDVGNSVTGGSVYRGSAIPSLRGSYIYADYVSARFFRLSIDAGADAGVAAGVREITDQLRPATGAFGGIASFGRDNRGELYVAAFTPGAVYRIVAAP
jgi:glucose/arabinose dehydrogenase